MAGTLTISTLSDGTNSTSSTNCIQGSAKAWVNFNGASGAIRANYNVSSVSRLSTGRYQVNFSNAFSDVNYSVAGQSSLDGTVGSSGTVKVVDVENISTMLTGSCVIGSFGTSTTAATDGVVVTASFFR